MIVLDTHAWIWFLDDPRKLSARARKATAQAMSQAAIYISSISVWEVALLVARGRLELTMDVRDWIAKCESLPFLTFVPVDNAIFLRSVFLPSFHSDPADRIIAATALLKGMPIVTKDQRIRKSPGIETIW